MSLYDKTFWVAISALLGGAAYYAGLPFFIVFAFVVVVGMMCLRIAPPILFIIPVMLLGFFYADIYEKTFGVEHIPFGEEAVLRGVVATEPAYGAQSQRITLALLPPHKGELTIYTAPHPWYYYGEKLEVSGVAEKSPSGQWSMVSFPEITRAGEGSHSSIKAHLFSFKRRMVNHMERALPPTEAALLAGEAIGERAGFTKEFKEAMNLSGTTHIVALSGHNISVVMFAALYAFGYFLSPRVALTMSIVLIALFVVMTGAEASAVRAGIMGAIAVLAMQAGRLQSTRNAITLAALAMALWNPRVLVDIGFQLSFAALLGIVYLLPVLKEKLSVEAPGVFGWKYNALTTASAQVAVAPILLYHFGTFSLFSIVPNVLILEVVPYTMVLGFAVGLAGFFSAHLATLFGMVAHVLLAYQIAIIEIFSRFSYSIYL